jgi:hypothetical protein
MSDQLDRHIKQLFESWIAPRHTLSRRRSP